MFETLQDHPNDSLLALIGLYHADPRPDKVDLGVGVYRDEAGHTPIFRAVKAAERQIWERQDSKSYIAPEGDQRFLDLLWSLVGGGAKPDLVASVQTPGGSGALRLASELIRASGKGRIWLGLPTWPNHSGIFAAAGLEILTYPYFDVPSQAVLFDRMMTALSGARAGDAVLIHASCHNPTGAGLAPDQWDELAALLAARGLVPLIDNAYQGFAKGLDEDVAGLRRMIGAVPESLVAVSSSKSFGLYRERTGAVFAVAATGAAKDLARATLIQAGRVNYSMPPDHGAAVVRTILETPELKADWSAELESMRLRLNALRGALSDAVASRWSNASALRAQEGMFSLLPISAADVLRLRADHGLYMPTSGRINIAGLKFADVDRVAKLFTST